MKKRPSRPFKQDKRKDFKPKGKGGAKPRNAKPGSSGSKLGGSRPGGSKPGRTHVRRTPEKPLKTPQRPAAAKAPTKAPRSPAPTPGSLLWGIHAVAEAWLNPARNCLSLRVTENGMAALRESFEEAERQGLHRPPPVLVERNEIDALTPRGAVHQGVVLAAHPLPELSLDDLLGREVTPRLVVILDQVSDPHNVGAVLRSAAAFGADAVIVTERGAPGATGVLAKSASGALEHVPIIAVVNLARALRTLQDESFWCVGLAEEGQKDLSSCALNSGKIALVMGAEGEGLRRLTREHCDELARLPTQGTIGSLNVSNAAAIALYEAKRQKG